MVGFEQRTLMRQRQFWLEIAEFALRRWDLAPTEMRWLGQGSKVVIRVTAAGADYALRMHPPGSVNETWLRSELNWLSWIRRETDLLAPLPVAARVDGNEELLIELRHDLLPQPAVAHATLFDFIEGEVKSARDLRRADVSCVGEYLGKLHRLAQFTAADGYDGPRLTWEGLFGANSPYASPTANDLIGEEQRAVLDELAARLRNTLSRLDSRADASGLIHADLLAKNIVFREDAIAALDFEFCGWGYFLYDLAPLLWQLKGERAADYPELEEAIWRGYTSVVPAAENDRELLEPFIAARQFASIRWLAANLQIPTLAVAAPSLIEQRCRELETFLETGVVQRNTPTL